MFLKTETSFKATENYFQTVTLKNKLSLYYPRALTVT